MAAGISRFGGKAAVVTGGSRGIGAAVARRLAAEGADVAIGCRADQEAASMLVAELRADGARAVAVRSDVVDPEQIKVLIERAAAEFGRLDVLACCAGIEHFDALENITPADFDRVFTVNTRGQLLAVQHAPPTCAPVAGSS